MKRFLYAVRPTLDILGDRIAILLDREHTRNKFQPGWAYAERISLLSELIRKLFYCWLSIRRNIVKSNISVESNTMLKNLVLQALETERIQFLQKKYVKNFMLVNL